MQKSEGTARVEAFSDGVFAIAITLLVLEIKVPSHSDVGHTGLGYSLLRLWPGYLAFITSFLTILVIWVKHHWMFSLIDRSDHAFLYWNGLLLLFVTFLPFPTSVMADFLLQADAKVAATLYTGTILSIAAAFKGLWWHASVRKSLLTLDASSIASGEIQEIGQQARIGPMLYLAAFGASFVSEWASLGICLLVAFYFMLRDALSG
ncbi:MAG: DUF1211 domain-containing protein [Gammaproteobacteria bacterium]|nr:DUF1211 domain-containing protein [Gammaproteobacteria bacterium]